MCQTALISNRMLQTLKSLYATCRKLPKEAGLLHETERLGRNYSALYEINSDIASFKAKALERNATREVLQKASVVIKNIGSDRD